MSSSLLAAPCIQTYLCILPTREKERQSASVACGEIKRDGGGDRSVKNGGRRERGIDKKGSNSKIERERDEDGERHKHARTYMRSRCERRVVGGKSEEEEEGAVGDEARARRDVTCVYCPAAFARRFAPAEERMRRAARLPAATRYFAIR